MKINSYDIDGVIWLGKEHQGLTPVENDVIITGRSFEEQPETIGMLRLRGIYNEVFFNPLPFAKKSRETSGEHKAKILNELRTRLDGKLEIGCHFEDDEIQAAVIRKECPWITVVMVVHDLVKKENVRRHDY